MIPSEKETTRPQLRAIETDLEREGPLGCYTSRTSQTLCFAPIDFSSWILPFLFFHIFYSAPSSLLCIQILFVQYGKDTYLLQGCSVAK